MRLVTFSKNGRPRIGLWIRDEVVDLLNAFERLFPGETRLAAAPASVPEFLCLGDLAMDTARSVEEAASDGRLPEGSSPVKDVRLLAPVPRPGKILAVDYNYASFISDAKRYLERQGVTVPDWHLPRHPWIFGKYSTTVIGPGASILKPAHTETLDAEGELAIVIGKHARFVPESEALTYVAGYTLFNDVSDRAVEFRPSPSINHRLYCLGKNNDTFGPLGPCLFTPDELGDVRNHTIEVLCNGELVYRYRVGDAGYGVDALVSFCSHLFELEPGDIIAMGSGGGCGAFHEPAVYLKTGDMVRVQIPGLPSLENPVGDEVV
jgi:acylpyruvate hydrolase